MKQQSRTSNDTVDLLKQQIALQQLVIEQQQQLIKTQQELIKAHRRIDKMTPKEPKDKDAIWHLNDKGLTSMEAANSKDLETLRYFQEWIIEFANKYIKPFVHPKVYSECLNQMTRGLPERIARQQTLMDFAVITGAQEPSIEIENPSAKSVALAR